MYTGLYYNLLGEVQAMLKNTTVNLPLILFIFHKQDNKLAFTLTSVIFNQ